jgi:hypothetical protein
MLACMAGHPTSLRRPRRAPTSIWHNELKGLGYHPVALRVPGAITAQTATYDEGKHDHYAILEDAQARG